MRIGFDAKRAFFNFSGLGNYSRTLLRSLAQFYPQNNYFLYTPKLNHYPETDFLFNSNFQVRTAPQYIPGSIWRSRLMASGLKRDQLDIYHGLSHELPIGLRKTGIFSIVTIHDLIFLRFPQLYPAIDRKIYLAKIRQACKNAQIIIAISEQTKRDIRQFIGVPEEKIKVVYQSCSPAFHPNHSVQNIRDIRMKYGLPEKYLLYVGTVEERKNLLLIAKALAHLPVEFKCVAIGKKKEYFTAVKDFLQKEKLANRMVFPEEVHYGDLPLIYGGAQIFIYPSRFEGFGIPVLEAISSGIPVIAAKGSCLEEAGGPGSVYVDPDDEQALAHGVLHIADSAGISGEMSRKGLRFAENFSLQNTASALMNTYQLSQGNS
ncbi:MAG TPA: glycosyltransferase family 1 protein [Edaphocola sp.]|nr:glycosyltransferase family 1 protein [Edaphocola sp.]